MKRNFKKVAKNIELLTNCRQFDKGAFEEMFEHTMKYKECPMRNRGLNCDPVGGDCATGISDELCEAIHAAYNKGFRDGADQTLKIYEPPYDPEDESM